MKPPFQNKPLERRAFLRSGMRYGLLAGLAAVAARSVSGGRLGRQTCTNQGVCRGCLDYSGCELPQALSAKQAAPGAEAGSAYEEVTRIAGGETPSRYVAFGPDDRLYLATGTTVVILDQHGASERVLTLDTPVRCVAVAADGTTYVGLRNRIVVFDPQGNALSTWDIPGKRAWLTGLAVGANDLFAADAGNRVVLRFDRAGKLLKRIGEKDAERGIAGFVIPSPYLSVAIHPDGLLRVNNTGRHRVEAYTFEGDFEGSWGRASATLDGFCGCCNPIRLAPLPDGRMVTCEKGLPRVKIYSAAGEFESVVAPPGAFPENAQVGSGQRGDADAPLAGLGVAVDSHGRIAILDHVTGEIRLLQPKA